MARYVFQFTSAARSGEDGAFNQWYDDVHLSDVLKQPGFLSGQRYTVLDPAAARTRYVTTYEVECEDPQATLQKLFEGGKGMVISPSLDQEQVSIAILKPGVSRRA